MTHRGGNWLNTFHGENTFGCRRATSGEVSPFDFSFDALMMPEPPETPRVSEMDGEM